MAAFDTSPVMLIVGVAAIDSLKVAVIVTTLAPYFNSIYSFFTIPTQGSPKIPFEALMVNELFPIAYSSTFERLVLEWQFPI